MMNGYSLAKVQMYNMNSIIDKKTPKIGAYLGLMSLLSR